jgi:hypothetical protein
MILERGSGGAGASTLCQSVSRFSRKASSETPTAFAIATNAVDIALRQSSRLAPEH